MQIWSGTLLFPPCWKSKSKSKSTQHMVNEGWLSWPLPSSEINETCWLLQPLKPYLQSNRKESGKDVFWTFLSCQKIWRGQHLFFIFLLLNHSSKPLAKFKFIQWQLVYGVSEVDLDLSDKITGQNYNHSGKYWFVFGFAYHNWKITKLCPLARGSHNKHIYASNTQARFQNTPQ